MQRDSLPLGSYMVCLAASVPFGKPSLSLKTSMRVRFTSVDLRTKGLMVFSIRALTAEGYSRCTLLGHARASSFETLMNSTVSRVPLSSTALAPAALYLMNYRRRRISRGLRIYQLHYTHPNDIPSSPCSYFIFSSMGSLIVSAPISNISSTSFSTPWFFRLIKHDKRQALHMIHEGSSTYYQNPSLVEASHSLLISSTSPCLMSS